MLLLSRPNTALLLAASLRHGTRGWQLAEIIQRRRGSFYGGCGLDRTVDSMHLDIPRGALGHHNLVKKALLLASGHVLFCYRTRRPIRDAEHNRAPSMEIIFRARLFRPQRIFHIGHVLWSAAPLGNVPNDKLPHRGIKLAGGSEARRAPKKED